MNITAITCTGDRPEAFALCEKYMARQTLKPSQWIVLCDGETPTKCTQGQTFLHSYSWRGPASMMLKLGFIFGAGLIRGDAVAFIEDDDWYAPHYLVRQSSRLQRLQMQLVGEGRTIYWNCRKRSWVANGNMKHASLCATVVARTLFEDVRRLCGCCADPYLDNRLWALDASKLVFDYDEHPMHVGMKALPGRRGYGMGHRPTFNGTPDEDMQFLRALIGDDASGYAAFAEASCVGKTSR